MVTVLTDSTENVPPERGGLTFIEQLHALAEQICPNEKVPWLTGRNETEIIAIRGTCKLWSCPVCGARNGKKWLARILRGMNVLEEPRWYFITITAHEKMRGTDASLKNLREGWKKLYNRIRRRYGTSTYIKVWEYHEDSTLHLHILVARKIGKRWLKNNARECGMGYQVDSSRTKNPGQVAGYVSKYLLKGYMQGANMPKGLRRIEASRDFPKLPNLAEEEDYTWIVSFNRASQDRRIETIRGERKLIDLRPKSP